MYLSGTDSEQDRWLNENKMKDSRIDDFSKWIKENGRPLAILEFGAIKYDIHGMSVILDDDCMSEEVKDSYKYLILRPDCKLYSKWDTKASLIF